MTRQNLRQSDATEKITVFRNWLDATLPKNRHRGSELPNSGSEACYLRGCTAITYMSDIAMRASHPILGLRPGRERKTDAFDALLISHNLACTYVTIARVERVTKHAMMAVAFDGADMVTTKTTVRTLELSAPSGILETTDYLKVETLTVTGSDKDKDFSGQEHNRVPTELSEIGLILRAMQTEICGSLGISLPETPTV